MPKKLFISFGVITIILLLGFFFYIIVNNPVNSNKYTDIFSSNVVELKDEQLTAYKKLNFTIYSSKNNEIQKNLIESIIDKNSELLLPNISKKSEDNIEIVISNKPISQFADLSQKYSLFKQDIFFVSGNSIIIPSESSQLLSYPDRFTDNLLMSVLATSIYNDFEKTQLTNNTKSPSILDSNIIKNYALISNGDIKNWQNPYKEKSSEYKKYSELCENLDNILRLFFCEYILVANGNDEKVPQEQQKFLKPFLNSFNINFKILDRNTPKDFDNFFEKFINNKSKLAYRPQYKEEFKKGYYLSKGISFNNINQEELNKVLLDNNFNLNANNKYVDSQFGANITEVVYEKLTLLTIQYIVVQTLDTNTLNIDCIVEGQGSLFCGENSIKKNSGNYFNINFLETNKY